MNASREETSAAAAAAAADSGFELIEAALATNIFYATRKYPNETRKHEEILLRCYNGLILCNSKPSYLPIYELKLLTETLGSFTDIDVRQVPRVYEEYKRLYHLLHDLVTQRKSDSRINSTLLAEIEQVLLRKSEIPFTAFDKLEDISDEDSPDSYGVETESGSSTIDTEKAADIIVERLLAFCLKKSKRSDTHPSFYDHPPKDNRFLVTSTFTELARVANQLMEYPSAQRKAIASSVLSKFSDVANTLIATPSTNYRQWCVHAGARLRFYLSTALTLSEQAALLESGSELKPFPSHYGSAKYFQTTYSARQDQTRNSQRCLTAYDESLQRGVTRPSNDNFLFYTNQVQLADKLISAIERANKKMPIAQQKKALPFLITHHVTLLILKELMGPETTLSYLKSMIVSSVLPLERFLTNFPRIPNDIFPIIKAYYQQYAIGKISIDKLNQLHNIIGLMATYMTLRRDMYVREKLAPTMLEALLKPAGSSQFIPCEEAATILTKEILSVVLGSASKEGDVSSVDLTKMYSLQQICDLVKATSVMKENEYRDIYLDMLRHDFGIKPGPATDILHSDEPQPGTIAAHNARIHEGLREEGIDVEKALNFTESHEFVYFPDAKSDAPEVQLDGALRVLWSYIEKFKPLVGDGQENIRKTLNNLYRFVVPKTGSDADLNKLKQKTALELFQKLTRQLLAIKVHPDPRFNEFSGHIQQQCHLIAPLVMGGTISKSQRFQNKPKRFVVKMWDKSDKNTFFLGDYVGCCLSPGGGRFSAIVQRRMDDAMLFPVVIDPDTKEPIALLWLYIAKDKEGKVRPVVNFCEVKSSYGQNPDVRCVLLNALLHFVGEKYCKANPNFGSLWINELSYGWNEADLTAHKVHETGYLTKFGGPFVPGFDQDLAKKASDDKQMTQVRQHTLQHYYLTSLSQTRFHAYEERNLEPEEQARYESVDALAIRYLEKATDDVTGASQGQMKEAASSELFTFLSAFYPVEDVATLFADQLGLWWSQAFLKQATSSTETAAGHGGAFVSMAARLGHDLSSPLHSRKPLNEEDADREKPEHSGAAAAGRP